MLYPLSYRRPFTKVVEPYHSFCDSVQGSPECSHKAIGEEYFLAGILVNAYGFCFPDRQGIGFFPESPPQPNERYGGLYVTGSVGHPAFFLWNPHHAARHGPCGID